MTLTPSLVWFRNDLRLRDNPALYQACLKGGVVPVFILDDQDAGGHAMGAASRWWLHESLSKLNHSLGGRLVLRQGRAMEELRHLLRQTGAQAIYWNRCYEPWRRKRDADIETELKTQGVKVESFQAGLLWEPWDVLNKQGRPYKVFTPFYRKGCMAATEPREPLPVANLSRLVDFTRCSEGLTSFGLMPGIDWYQQMQEQWQPGEEGAAARMEAFLSAAAFHYHFKRDIPSAKGTSRLSPSLHFGELSPNQVWYAAKHAFDMNHENAHLDTFLSELGWREFSHYLLYHFPGITQDNFNQNYNVFPWVNDDAALSAWQSGNTGIPIIDAGMRELWQTGYMHNRVRMLVGSFLVKNLRVDWRKGEAWFRDCLLDADLAVNCVSWQWVAGSGADAAPYFRIFNPVLQGQKFDPEGVYVKRYCPELNGLSKRYIHNPWDAPDDELAKASVRLGGNYPAPIVDLKASRIAALEAYQATKV